ncbi:hypothetical protein GH714_017922 [Hevea brasiliensis]|uniref:Disease resistance N-terminal domain-containing protein n=1 Tax=Hevea brasiliensis TaxID=3981 RepID=A0A6A6N546_HEVBR|nr:hypothetical protein GH714_017922 [Hevea brasiliensis]
MELASSIGGSILSPFFDGFLAQLKFIVDKGQVSAQLQNWESILKRIHAVLDDAEEKHTTNRLVELWLNDLRDLAYDVEDVLDELVTEVQAQQRRLEEEPQVRPNKLRKIFNTIFAALNPSTVKFSVEMVAKIESITVRLDKIVYFESFVISKALFFMVYTFPLPPP